MQTEIEAKFINIDIEQMRQTLRDAGAVCEQPMRLMRRSIIETPELRERGAFLRIRDEGDKITTTYKQFANNSLTGAQEIELTISDYDAMVALYEQLGYPVQSYQESKRETWTLEGVEIVIDVWPHLEPYVEIEGPSEFAVMAAAKKLGFDWTQAIFGKVTEVYQLQYPDGDADKLVQQPKIVFDQPLPRIMTGQANGS